ncbi:Bug family tripartite tricarboxylate transporter substrate binding protein [Polynucleobacter rarus]|uniref:Bug family tripartite tricarboxylate transporter substrate binding protein n=1 Tax=Polynucleobacter rarus TaxID=556055 RepID=UPI000D3ECCC9|nr:tripartite tricarboxylate transporter substrate binding protein [Polynucleobacter rarus]
MRVNDFNYRLSGNSIGIPFAILSIMVCLMTFLANPSYSQSTSFPQKPITLIVPYTAGGGVDSIARLIVPLLSERLGQRVVIENKPGVSGMVGAQYVAKAAPDGYTLLAGNTTTNATNYYLTKSSGYHPIKDFVPLSLWDRGPTVLVVPANSRFQTVNDVIKELKNKPGSLNYGTSGLGSAHHLSAEVFMHLTGTSMQHVPYKGGPGVMADLIGGQLDLAFEVVPVASPFIKSGRLRALGVSSKSEIPALPGVKPIADIAVPGYQMETWQGAFAPAGTPVEITEKLGKEFAAVVQTPQIQQKMQELGLIPDYRNNNEFKEFLQADFAMWGKLVKDANIKAE